MSAPKDFVTSGEFPEGTFAKTGPGRAAKRYAELVWAIRYERLKLGWSQARLARQTNVSRATVSRLESGEKWTRPEILFLVLEELKVDTTFQLISHHYPKGFGK